MLRHLELTFIKIHILYHACKEELYGVGIMEELNRHGYKVGPGLLYTTLSKMEAEGFLTCRKATVDHKQRKYYRATEKGIELMNDMQRKIIELYEEVVETG